jgi:hypothetical protein
MWLLFQTLGNLCFVIAGQQRPSAGLFPAFKHYFAMLLPAEPGMA